jgi:hypothetical protein
MSPNAGGRGGVTGSQPISTASVNINCKTLGLGAAERKKESISSIGLIN